METDIFTIVHNVLQGDKRGHDYHTDCPFCGKPAARGQTHFSYSAQGYKCFVCGNGGGLATLAAALGQAVTAVAQPPKPKPIKRRAAWVDRAGDLVARYTAHPQRVTLWQAHKPVSEEMVFNHNLGIGVLPSSQCQHTRLILPIYNEGKVVCLRGRRLACDCTKWLAAGGWTLADLPLHNLDALPHGGILWIVENPVDALLVGQFTCYTGAATLSVSYWRDEWATAIVAKRPSLVVVAYDNDLPGNGGGWRREEMIKAWGSGKVIPQAAGVRLANVLQSAGLNAVIFDWKDAPAKSDIGSLLAQ